MEEVQTAIEALQRAREAKLVELRGIEQALEALGAASAGAHIRGRGPRKDYEDLGVTAAARRFLRETREPQDTRTIADALLNRGLVTNSQNFIATVYATLRNGKMFKRTSDGKWQLLEQHE